MATYVMVHGACHGGWSWYRVATALHRRSHRVLAPDLLSQGCNRRPPQDIALGDWVNQVVDLIERQADPVILVGHSRGGIILSEVAERIPEKLGALVYVTAFLLEDGGCIQNVLADEPESAVSAAMEFSGDGKCLTLKGESVRELFYNECNDEDVELAKSLLVPEPVAPLQTPIRTTAARFGRVPRVYVQCNRDRVITPHRQELMQSRLPCRSRIVLEADHSPFFSRTAELSAALAGLA